MSDGNLLSISSKSKPPVSILKTKPTNAARQGKSNRVSVEINSRQSVGKSGSKGEASGGHRVRDDLQEENSQLVAQNHRLLSELETTSQQLLNANSKLGELGEELAREKPAQSKVEMLEAQVRIMQEKLSKSASAQWKLDSLASGQQREKEEWRTRQKLLEQQLSNVKQECQRLRESHAAVEERASQLSFSSNSGPLVKSSSTHSLPAAYHQSHPSSSVSSTTTAAATSSRPHPQHSGSTHKSFLLPSETTPLANSTLLKLSPPSLSGSTSSLSSVKSTKSAQDFTRYPCPNTTTYLPYGRLKNTPSLTSAGGWSKYNSSSTMTSTPKPKPSSSAAMTQPASTSASVYQSHPSSTTAGYPSFSSYGHHHRLGKQQPPQSSATVTVSGAGGAVSTASGSRGALKRPGVASSHGSLTGVASSMLSDPASAARLSMSYLGVSARGERGEACANGVSGGDSGSTGSDSMVSGTSGRPSSSAEETKTQRQKSVLLSPNMELERARAKIRLLQKEVVLLEQQLSDKTLSSQSHVEELTRMRTELAQERASIAIFKQELEESSSKEVERVKTLHGKQSAELADQLERMRQEKREMERDSLKQKAELKAKIAEISSLTEHVSSLRNQLEQERRSHDQAMQLLHSEVKGGSQHVSELERALRACQDELEGHVTRVEEASRMQKAEVEELQKHVEVLSSELEHTQTQLLDKTELATRLQREISELRGEWQREVASWREREAELKQNLHHGDVLRQSLIQQVERSNLELNSLSGRLSEQQRVAREMKKSQNDLETLRRHTIEVESEKEHLEAKLSSLKEEKQKLLVDLGQEKTRNTKLAGQLKQLERQLGSEVGRREEGEGRAAQMKDELERVRRELEKERERVAEVEVQAREKESTVEDTLGHMQQELAKRAQQVLEMDGLLRNHQADTTARRLQLERTLAQRQSELRTRTQEVEELTVKLSEARRKVGEMEGEVGLVKSERLRENSEQKKLLQEKEAELSLLKGRLKEVESMGVANSRELGHLKSELGSVGAREREWEERCGQLRKQAEQLQRENDTLREQHLTQVQRLRDNHSSLLSSREQEASSHRQQLEQLVEQERVRQEEVGRCRAQVASLSAELAAERRVSEEARQQLAMVRTDAARSQAQITSLQKALQSIPSTPPASTSTIAPPISTGNHTHHQSSSSGSLPLHMLSRPTTSSAPLDQSASSRQTPNLPFSASSTSKNNGIIDI